MEKRNYQYRRLSACVGLALAVLLAAGLGCGLLPSDDGAAAVYGAGASARPGGSEPLFGEPEDSRIEPYYQEVLGQWRQEGVPSGTETIVIPASRYSAASEDAGIRTGSYEGESDALIWANQRGWIEYEADVSRAGLYQIKADYYPLPVAEGGGRQPVMLSARVNGAYPFNEARAIAFEREYRDIQPPRFDDRGNQIRAQVEELKGWKEKMVTESNGAYSTPLLWHLKQGKNKIRLEMQQQPVAFRQFTLLPPDSAPAYAEVKAQYPAAAAREGAVLTIEAEQYSAKNSTSIQNVYDRDPFSHPASMNAIVYNTLGGARWTKGGQAVTWTLDAPQDGLYKLALRANQNTVKNMSVFRTLTIDGKLPFREMEQVQFPYDSGWQGITLSDADGEPYAFYLAKGRHTLTMEATHAPYMSIIIRMDHISRELRAILLELRMVTGNREDKYRVWNVEKDIPGLTDRLERIREQFVQLQAEMKQINPKTDDVAQMLKNGAEDIKSILKTPNQIPYSQERIASVQESLESNRATLMNSPLQLDQIYLAPLDEELPRMTSSFWEKAGGMFQSLAYSFEDRTGFSDKDDSVLNVWMIWGRDYVDELQHLVNDRFTPETGIKVHINLIQNAQMLTLANASGMMPDVALGVPSNVPFDMALRNAALNLSELPGADEFFARYSPGMLQPLYYDGGYYGVPETVSFKVLFYRKDVLQRLGLSVPDTWDDVYQMLPTLLQNQYNFYMDPADYTPILFQSGVEMYAQTGLTTGLDTPEAFKAYKMWTDFYNVQGLERVVQSFYNQFRRGDIPIGMSDFNMYMQLLVAAPEIANEWAIAPIPGTRQPDGRIARWSGGSNPSNAMLFKSSAPEKQKQAWTFLQWYTSTETQTEFGLNLEQYHGETFRWNTANVQAFAEMPWKPDDLRIILQQWAWTKEVPQVPGGYMTDREIGFAWNRTVVDAENSRISLEKAIKEIKRELRRKQQEFDIIGPNGEVRKTLDLPVIQQPWKGVDQLVE
ncbi:extracellular solute-binding protein [Paenibacillus dendritiformis]|uniref:extracellular solute-binding protein n=3 Tax=Paenibacillus dendritiformis TaxID=130049 RepID=UPI001560091B|nr:extracellular solute-binding protein [Paenibacillus dendritiformis]NRF98513.1 extracellular solute-binding protein [Paenibacillus dendritiformis]